MITRRNALKAGAGLAAAGTLGAPAILHAQAATLKITTWGGKWGDIMKATVLPAFEKEFKCTVSADQSFPFLPKLQASPKNDPLYDVFHTNSNEQWNALTEGLVLPKITAKEVPNVADVYDYAVSDKIVGVSIFTSAIGLGYRTDKVKKPPKSWADLWNVKDFPGRRSLRKYPFDTIEEALMADGVPTNKVYPCDFDRAYKSLDKIKKDVAVWWTSGAQTTQMLKSGEVDMLPTWNGRARMTTVQLDFVF